MDAQFLLDICDRDYEATIQLLVLSYIFDLVIVLGRIEFFDLQRVYKVVFLPFLQLIIRSICNLTSVS